MDFFKCRVVIFFSVEAGLLNCMLTAAEFRAEPGNHPHEALCNSGLTSADSGLQLESLGDRAKRCLSEDPAPAAYSAVPKIS